MSSSQTWTVWSEQPAASRLPLGEKAIDQINTRSEEHTSELQSLRHLVCRLLLEKKNKHADTSEVHCNNEGKVAITIDVNDNARHQENLLAGGIVAKEKDMAWSHGTNVHAERKFY